MVPTYLRSEDRLEPSHWYSGKWNHRSDYHLHPLLPLLSIPHWWSWDRSNILLHWWQGCTNDQMYSCLAYFSTPRGHPSSEIPMHPYHYCKRCTISTSCHCGSWWLLSDLGYLSQQAFWSPILEAHLWTSWVCYHYNHFPFTCSLYGYGPFYRTCDISHLTWQITLF